MQSWSEADLYKIIIPFLGKMMQMEFILDTYDKLADHWNLNQFQLSQSQLDTRPTRDKQDMDRGGIDLPFIII